MIGLLNSRLTLVTAAILWWAAKCAGVSALSVSLQLVQNNSLPPARLPSGFVEWGVDLKRSNTTDGGSSAEGPNDSVLGVRSITRAFTPVSLIQNETQKVEAAKQTIARPIPSADKNITVTLTSVDIEYDQEHAPNVLKDGACLFLQHHQTGDGVYESCIVAMPDPGSRQHAPFKSNGTNHRLLIEFKNLKPSRPYTIKLYSFDVLKGRGVFVFTDVTSDPDAYLNPADALGNSNNLVGFPNISTWFNPGAGEFGDGTQYAPEGQFVWNNGRNPTSLMQYMVPLRVTADAKGRIVFAETTVVNLNGSEQNSPALNAFQISDDVGWQATASDRSNIVDVATEGTAGVQAQRTINAANTAVAFHDSAQAEASTTQSAVIPGTWQGYSMSELADAVANYNVVNWPKSAQQSRTAFAQMIGERYFDGDTAISKSIAADRTRALLLLDAVKADLPFDMARQIRDWLLVWVRKPDVLVSISSNDLDAIYRLLTYFRASAPDKAQTVKDWLCASPQWRALDLDEVIELLDHSGTSAWPQNDSARRQITDHVWRRMFDGVEVRPDVTTNQLVRAIIVNHSVIDASTKGKLSHAIIARYARVGDLNAMLGASEELNLIIAARLIGVPDPQTATLIASWAKSRDDVPIDYVDKTDPIREAATFGEMMERAADPKAFADDLIRQLYSTAPQFGSTTAKVLAVAASAQGDTVGWHKQLLTTLSNSSTQDNSKSSLYLALADLDEVTRREGLDDGDDLEDARHALSVADNDNARLRASQWLAWHLATQNRPEEAQTAVEDVIKLVTDLRVLHELYVLRETIGSYSSMLENVRAHVAEKRMKAISGQLVFLEGQLSRAKHEGRPTEEIQALEKLVENTKNVGAGSAANVR